VRKDDVFALLLFRHVLELNPSHYEAKQFLSSHPTADSCEAHTLEEVMNQRFSELTTTKYLFPWFGSHRVELNSSQPSEPNPNHLLEDPKRLSQSMIWQSQVPSLPLPSPLQFTSPRVEIILPRARDPSMEWWSISKISKYGSILLDLQSIFRSEKMNLLVI
jgi:hypothetical protein